MKNITLIGQRCAGKSVVGVILAQKLNCSFTDLDEIIEDAEKQTVSEIFSRQGELVFRDIESVALEEVIKFPNKVIACGGGVVLREKNIALLRRRSRVVWLEASAATCAKRMQADESNGRKRPALTNMGSVMEITTLLAARLPFYATARHFRVKTDDMSPEQVADGIISLIRKAPNG